MLELALIFFFPFFVAYGAASDLFSMTIPNRITLALMVGFMVMALWINMDWETIAWHWAMFAIVLSITFTLFALGFIGGGDAKLAAGIALWMGWEHSLMYFLLAAFLGGILTIIIIKIRNVPMPDWVMRQQWAANIYRAERIPYGISMGAAAIMVYAQTIWMQYVFNPVM
ncbi:MAG: prepilin peptidase [Rhizobiaceae bacterium]|nr:prepilin peptidase [Rhizobiaceae bacterium]